MRAQVKRLATGVAVAPIHATGEVVGAETDRYAVRTDRGVLGARRAASCLLQPELGDAVLVSGPATDSVFIIAVLERAGNGPARIVVEGDTELAVRGGALSLTAEAGLSMCSDAHLALTGHELTLRSTRATFLFGRLSAFGQELAASVGQVRLIGSVLESVVERFTQRAKLSLRSVEGLDQVRSGVMDYRADQAISLRGGNVLATAKELVKIDGKQVHLG